MWAYAILGPGVLHARTPNRPGIQKTEPPHPSSRKPSPGLKAGGETIRDLMQGSAASSRITLRASGMSGNLDGMRGPLLLRISFEPSSITRRPPPGISPLHELHVQTGLASQAIGLEGLGRRSRAFGLRPEDLSDHNAGYGTQRTPCSVASGPSTTLAQVSAPCRNGLSAHDFAASGPHS